VNPRSLPRGLPRHLRTWYVVTAAVVSAVAAATAPMCPVMDAEGRALWRVETVNDGDTVSCRDVASRMVRIRLVGIDAPELDQPGGSGARSALAAKVGGRNVRVEGAARDQHGRLLGTLWLDGRDINREMVADGWAWAFTGFADDEDLMAAESAARQARRGLWAEPNPVPPSRWRAQHPSHRPR